NLPRGASDLSISGGARLKKRELTNLPASIHEMKDYFDLWVFTESFEFDRATLAEAIRATFDRQRTALPTAVPIGLTDSFGQHPEKLAQWRAFVKRGKLKSGSANLSEVVTRVREFLMPMVNAFSSSESLAGKWLPKLGWKI
ncbi:MAG: nucleotidyl transferase AbiEii/AbiGii toxin family protein, partial [Acidobacteria bacterium]|nr:nucleotidyl transferase AbiEii/AbiGii toxin family protein [Acidobacteriota bacterium]